MYLQNCSAYEIVLPIALMLYSSTGVLADGMNLIQTKEILLLNGWTIKTAVCTILFSLMHWPCSTTCLTIYKETKSVKWTLLAIVIPTICGVITCGIVNLFSLLV
ncbi:MAG: iron transporter [Clostridia bacterium]|nr:iron transporter [Clostridia bacterium]